MDNVEQFTKKKSYQRYQDKANEIMDILREDEISLVEAIGIIEVTKLMLVDSAEARE